MASFFFIIHILEKQTNYVSYDPFNKLEKDHQEVKGLIYANLSFSLMATIRLQSEIKKK